jgi:hypothetical protein
MKPKNKSEAEPRKARKDRYWSVMLVGEHGRIVPLKWFKGFFITFVALLMLAIGAAALLGFFYKQQAVEIDRLQNELRLIKDQAAKLRDEKDLYLTQFVASQKNNPPAVRKEEQPEPIDIPAPSKSGQQKPAQPPRKAPPSPAPKPKPATEAVQWKADIRRFAVTYDPDREVLKAQFRIYNTSKPKRPLAGRSVVAFKEMDTSPLKWFTVPRVPISEGKPDGAMGQAFKINNYRTMTFRAYQQKIPVTYDTASVFIFSADGKLITERDFAFHIDAKPPAVAPSQSATCGTTVDNPGTRSATVANPGTAATVANQAPAAPPSTIQAPAALHNPAQPPIDRQAASASGQPRRSQGRAPIKWSRHRWRLKARRLECRNRARQHRNGINRQPLELKTMPQRHPGRTSLAAMRHHRSLHQKMPRNRKARRSNSERCPQEAVHHRRGIYR